MFTLTQVFPLPFAIHFLRTASQAASGCLIDEEDVSKGYVMIRIGFHSGPTTAAVVGTRMREYGIYQLCFMDKSSC